MIATGTSQTTLISTAKTSGTLRTTSHPPPRHLRLRPSTASTTSLTRTPFPVTSAHYLPLCSLDSGSGPTPAGDTLTGLPSAPLVPVL
ncbi:mucin-5AC-like [Nothobranchius furzeri]|uniref:mucin-5AC-like n=1 Tax=Nothobranchius furzeri TaxID=105023 RepID=UPI003904A32C